MVDSNVVVVGGGSWGTTIAHMLSERAPTKLWVRSPELCEQIQTTNRNGRYLPGFDLSPKLTATSDLESAVSDADVVVFAVPTHAMRDVCHRVGAALSSRSTAVSLAKGFEPATNLRMSEVIRSELGTASVGVLTGPNLCKEILAGKPASGVVAFDEHETAMRVQELFTTKTFRLFTNTDVIGCELGGALKNVYVIAAAIVEGLGWGDNARAAVITRSLRELLALGSAMGAEESTLVGLAGMGDLVASCMSWQSRNATVGRGLGQGHSLDDILSKLGQVAEGVPTARSVHELSTQYQVEMPIAEHVYSVCWKAASASGAAGSLLRGKLGIE